MAKEAPEAESEQPQGPTDTELVDEVLEGKIIAYDELVNRYKERLFSVIYNMTSNHEDANDILMETFDKAYRNLAGYRKNSSFYTWIYRIAINQSLNFLKKRKRRGSSLSLNELNLDADTEKEIAQFQVSEETERSVALGELQKKLNESLQKLSDEHRTVVVLFDIDGMSHGDIAKVLGVSEGTVRSRLHYAHKKLRKMLDQYLK